MRRALIVLVAGVALVAAVGAAKSGNRAGTYDVTMETIEACSCPLFCGCYFNSEPNDPHMCQFNNAYKFTQGSHYGKVDLSGQKVWASGDLGPDGLSKGEPSWVTLTFDKKATPAQRDAIVAVFGQVFPVKWRKVDTREDDITWEHNAGNDHAKMGSGMAEVTLKRGNWEATKQPTVIQGLKYFGSDSNDGFVLAKGTHYFHGKETTYDYTDRNGFYIRIHKKGAIEAPAKVASK
jgi:hypothetical protein